ncbi:BAR-domain-containing protein [Martensiomyces pterosporus]|nr:BAR-domain-containing protein [Martensiomyces pterosporus]
MGSSLLSSDPEFNEQEQRFRNLERKALRLIQDTKSYRDSISEMTSSQKKLAESLTAFLIDVQRPQEHQAAYRQASMAIDESSRPMFDEVYVQTVMEPIARYCGYLPEFDKAIKKRKHRLEDLEKAKRALAKEQGKAAQDPVAVEKAEQDVQYAAAAYENLNVALITETPKLINSRVYVIDPSFEAFVKAQLQFFNDSLQQMENVGRFLPPQDALNDERVLNDRIESVMGQLRTLSICSLNV